MTEAPKQHNPNNIQIGDEVVMIGSASDGTVMAVARIYLDDNSGWVAVCMWHKDRTHNEQVYPLVVLEKYDSDSLPPAVIMG